MKFPKSSKIERLVSKDPTQRVLNAPWLDVEAGVLKASSGQNALLLPVEIEEGDTSGPVPVELIKKVRASNGSLACGAEWIVAPDGTATPRSTTNSRFPPIEPLCAAPEQFVEINLNARLLAELAGAMGCEVVKIRIPVEAVSDDINGSVIDTSAMQVTPHPSEPHIDGAIGALLPYRVARV